MSPFDSVLKAVFDRVISILMLLLLSPLLLVLALLVKLGDGGPVLFSQIRVGKDEKQFPIYKFRSMTVAKSQGVQVTSANDQRITPIGRILRKTKLDELPQLLNIMKGDMSFVGPRPEVPRYVEYYSEQEKEVLTVKPGLTDKATLEYRNEEEILADAEEPEKMYVDEILPAKLALSLSYLERASFVGDLLLIAKTFLRILFPKGES